MKKGGKKWIEFNFDTTVSLKESPKLSNKEPVECIDLVHKDTFIVDKKSNSSEKINFNFLERLQPKSVGDLAVHNKKIKEVEDWLQQNVIASSKEEFSPILLLTGPTGCGKTATVTVLCKTMNVKVKEWINPVDQSYEAGFSQSQVVRFLDFFTQSKYKSLCDDINNKSVVLVEDFPNFVTYNPNEFKGILELCHDRNTPVIFICTDASSGKLDLSQKLFPQEIREKLQIANINFNPCSATLLKSALKRACKLVQSHPDLFRMPSSDVIEAVVSSTMGDIRCALNQFHFACLKGTKEMPTSNFDKSQGAKRKRKEKPVSSIKSMAKDETLGLFHGLGRVLNPKRKEIGNSWRIECDVDLLIDQFATQPSIFSAFLQENYLKYFGDLSAVQKASDILSHAQGFLDKWTERHDIFMYALWISVLGLMIFNEHKMSKWTQIKAPTKVKPLPESSLEAHYIDKTDRLYYNIITKSNKFYTFNQ